MLAVVALLGLPVNQLPIYVLLLIVTVVIFSGEVAARPRGWLAAVTIVAVAVAGQICWRRRASTKGIMCFCRAADCA